MTGILIEGGRALRERNFSETSLLVEAGRIKQAGTSGDRAAIGFDARGLLVLPGIVDLHGDAFERQMMPRSGVDFPIDVALLDSDRQAISNGITTVFHAATWSWEPGLRSGANARKLLEAIEALQPRLAADTRFHLRHETYNLDAEGEIEHWLQARRVDLFAFNNHMESTVASLAKPHKRSRMVDRTGLSSDAFDQLVERVVARRQHVPGSIARLARIASKAGIRMLSHDDDSPAMRQTFRALGVGIAEFPVNEDTARAAADANDDIVFGAPNVVRGGSHTGWTRAADMIEKGLCSILASDYYYPAPILAAFRLAVDGILPLADAWGLISAAPARAAGLSDRGILAEGRRADIILVDDTKPMRPRVVAVFAGGQLVHLTEANRLVPQVLSRRRPVAAEL